MGVGLLLARPLGIVAALVTLGGIAGCSGGTPAEGEVAAAPGFPVPAPLIEASWPVQMDEAALGPYQAQPGWIALVTRTDVRGAVEQLGPLGGMPAARAHAEAAMLYRQAARLTAIAARETYGESPRETDPPGAQHLVAMGWALEGDLERARAALGDGLTGLDGAAAAWHAPWAAWIAAGAPWPPDLSGLPTGLPAPSPGQWPEVPTGPHYSLAEQVDGAATLLDVADPGALVALALWHDAAAAAAAGSEAARLEVLRARYAFPAEPDANDAAPLPMDLLFGSDLLVPGDGPFLVDLLGAAGPGAVEAHASTSLLAALARDARREGRLVPELAQDAAGEVRTAALDAMVAKAGGNTLGHHRVFADVASVGVLRALALVAEVEGDHEGAGILLINAMERSSSEWTADPKALLFLSAWDADNRYPVRGTELLHNLIRRYPSLEGARFGLDALTLRESRARGSQIPGQ